MSINKVILVGRLGQDPELKQTQNGVPVCNFSLATTEKYTSKDGQKKEKTEWHKVIVWQKLGEVCNQYLSKGKEVYVEGSIQTRSWEDDKQVKRFSTEVVAKNVQFLGANNEQKKPAQSPQEQSGAQFTTTEIPF